MPADARGSEWECFYFIFHQESWPSEWKELDGGVRHGAVLINLNAPRLH